MSDTAVLGGGGPGSLPQGPGGKAFASYMNESNKAISWVATKAKRAAAVPEEVQDSLEKMRDYLSFLEDFHSQHEGIVGESFKEVKPKVLAGLVLIFDPQHESMQRFFTKDDKKRARVLHEWASDPDVLEDLPLEDDETVAPAASRASRASSSSSSTAVGKAVITKPPPSHPIWGRNGIMNGLALTGSKGTTVCFNPDLKHQKPSASVIGHNGIPIGTWYPSQMSACWNGAHGSSQGGIAPSKEDGVYSVIVAETYKGLDEDNGTTIWYSGSGSIENKNPDQAVHTTANDALRKSRTLQNPVRVLRKAPVSSRNPSAWAPSCGLRYDGLYLVTGERTGTNDNGGRYVQFRLQRMTVVNKRPQPPLEDCLSIPSREQRAAFGRIKEYF